MSGAVWSVTWRVAARRRRLLAWNLLVPALLLVPVATSGAAAAHRAIVLTVFVAFFGAYGSCIPLLRDGMSGWAEKVLLTGYGGRRWLIERLLASTLIDWLQLLPANLVVLALVQASWPVAAAVLGFTALALLFANLLGVFVAAGVRALGEAALGCAVLSLLALHAAGVFRTPDPASWWAIVEAWSPLRPLHESWLGVLAANGAPTDSARPVASAALLIGLASALGRRLAARISGVRPEW